MGARKGGRIFVWIVNSGALLQKLSIRATYKRRPHPRGLAKGGHIWTEGGGEGVSGKKWTSKI